MKRTKQVFHKEGDEVPKYVSGCRQFDGEDIHYQERMKENAERQKQWVMEQTGEKNWNKAQEKAEEQAYAEQTETLNRMRGMLEDEAAQRKANMMKEIQEENKRLAREKRDKEQKWRQNQERHNQFEIANTNNSNIMTENAATTISEHAGHRYVPYHFKGLRPDQIDEINAQREQQVRDAKEKKAYEAEEERQWAMQQEANRQLMMQNETELQEKQRQMMAMHKTQHKQDKIVKEVKWQNHYGEQVPLPHV